LFVDIKLHFRTSRQSHAHSGLNKFILFGRSRGCFEEGLSPRL